MAEKPATLDFTKPSEAASDKGSPSRDEQIANALADQDKPAADDSASPKETPADPSRALFAEADETASDDQEEEVTEELFETEPDDQATVSKKTFVKRLGKVVAQRNALRTEKAAIEGEVKVLREQNEQLNRLAKVFQEKYGQFQNPEEMVLFDTEFMEKAEELARQDPTVAAAFRQVQEAVGRRNPTVTDPKPTQTPAPAATPQQDPTVAKIIRRDAERTITGALADLNVKPAFQRVLSEHIVNTTADLADLSTNDVVRLSREFIKERGFSPEEVLQAAATPEGDETPAKPATGSQPQAVSQPAPQSGEEGGPAAPKTRDEWEANRNARLAQIGRNLGLE